MKKLIRMMCMLVAALVVLGCDMRVQAEVTTYTEVKFVANVPEGFAGDVIVIWENTTTLKRDGVRMTADMGYSDSKTILGGDVYNMEVSFVAEGTWKSDMAAQYEIPNGEGIEIVFNVLDGSTAANVLTEVVPLEPESVEAASVASGSDEDIDSLTGILKGEVAIQNFIDKASFIESDPGYKNFLNIYGWDIMKEKYMDDNLLNTEERWESMTLFDRYVWGIGCYYPRMYFYMNAGEVGDSYTIDDYLEDAIIGEKVKFENSDYPKEDEVYAALVELCQWHYDYFLITGTVYDYYNGTSGYAESMGENVIPVEPEEIVELEEVEIPAADTSIVQEVQQAVKEDEELAELQKELVAELTEEEKEELGIDAAVEEKTEEGSGAFKIVLVVVLVAVVAGVGFVVGKKKGKE